MDRKCSDKLVIDCVQKKKRDFGIVLSDRFMATRSHHRMARTGHRMSNCFASDKPPARQPLRVELLRTRVGRL